MLSAEITAHPQVSEVVFDNMPERASILAPKSDLSAEKSDLFAG